LEKFFLCQNIYLNKEDGFVFFALAKGH